MTINRQPELPRFALMKIGQLLRSHYETRLVPENPSLVALTLIADAKLRNDPYLKGSRYAPR